MVGREVLAVLFWAALVFSAAVLWADAVEAEATRPVEHIVFARGASITVIDFGDDGSVVEVSR